MDGEASVGLVITTDPPAGLPFTFKASHKNVGKSPTVVFVVPMVTGIQPKVVSNIADASSGSNTLNSSVSIAIPHSFSTVTLMT